MKIVMKSDGGARGNPGPAGIGVVVYKYQGDTERQGKILLPLRQDQNDILKVQDDKNIFQDDREEGQGGLVLIHEISEYIGETTNNQAEYKALIAGLEWVFGNDEILKQVQNDGEIECRLDSELVVKQLNREYKMKNEGLKPLFNKVNKLVYDISKPIKFVHIYRENNKEADRLVNEAIDNQLNN